MVVYIIFHLLSLISLCSAGYYQLVDKIKSSLVNNSNYNANSEFRLEFGFRNLADDADLLANLANYGCWCLPLVGNYGKGTPVDDFDQLCKTLSQGYACAVQDAQLRGEI